MNFSSLQSLSNYFGEEGGIKEPSRGETFQLEKKNTLHSFTSLDKRNKEMGGRGGTRLYKKSLIPSGEPREGPLNKLISMIGFLEAEIESRDWPKGVQGSARRGSDWSEQL